MEHYFSDKPKSSHDIKEISYTIGDRDISFFTDSGVFSKDKVDFGSHVLISSLPKLKGQVLDLGCGYGPIGISLALLNKDAKISMVDINPRALELANKNITKNQVENAKAFLGDGFKNLDKNFDYIVTNPPIRAGKSVIYPMFEESFAHLKEGGSIFLVIQKKQGANSALKKLESIYGNCQAIAKKAGYWILESKK